MAIDSKHFNVPRREELLQQIAAANRWGVVIAAIEVMLSLYSHCSLIGAWL